jgi:hypothetical protein
VSLSVAHSFGIARGDQLAAELRDDHDRRYTAMLTKCSDNPP